MSIGFPVGAILMDIQATSPVDGKARAMVHEPNNGTRPESKPDTKDLHSTTKPKYRYDFEELNEQKENNIDQDTKKGTEKFYERLGKIFDNDFTRILDDISPAISLGILAYSMMTGLGFVQGLIYTLLPPFITKLNTKALVPWISRKQDQASDTDSKINLNIDLVFDSEAKRNLYYKIKQFLGYKSELQTESLAKTVGTTSGNLLILHGPPGTGKTAIAEGIANTADKPLLKVDVNDIESKWIGESESKIANKFKAAKKLGAYLFFDEADALLMPRTENTDSGGSISQNKMTNAFIQNFNDYRDSVKVILATNTAQSIDEAIKSRSILCHVPPPNLDMQIAILMKKLKDYGLNQERIQTIQSHEQELRDLFAKDFDHFTGRDIESGVKAALFVAEERIKEAKSNGKQESTATLTIDDLKTAFENLNREKEDSDRSHLRTASKARDAKAQGLKSVLLSI